ncbi:hypothetical protein M9Y10_000791 [Tritrichomonas musculus]|uniref:Small GTP-binding protein n=1 Tax=Tritrichomonas musculus TaxID=1915356 RepID=A0ABR2L552_9EUKA
MEKKVILVGSSGVGKTSLLCRYIKDIFDESINKPTVGSSYSKVIVENTGGQGVELQVWDTAGQEKFRSVASIFYRQAKIALICFDYQDKDSINDIDQWASSVSSIEPECVLYLVATKSDLLIDLSELKDFLEKKSSTFTSVFITSAKNNVGITEIFKTMADQEVHTENKKNGIPIDPKKNGESQEEKKCC